MTTFPHGTTIETLNDSGHVFHRVCAPGGGVCRYADNEDIAQDFANIYEEYFKHK